MHLLQLWRVSKTPAKKTNLQPSTSTDDNVEKFIAENGLDEQAARELRGEALGVQRAVVDQGPLSNVNNPSSAVLGRIKKAKQGMLGGSSSSMGAMGMMGGSGVDAEAVAEKALQFVMMNGIDEKGAESFMSESPEVQQAVMDVGSLESAKNKSSALMGRIARAKKSVGMEGMGMGMGGMGMGAMNPMMAAMSMGMAEGMLKGKGEGKQNPMGTMLSTMENMMGNMSNMMMEMKGSGKGGPKGAMGGMMGMMQKMSMMAQMRKMMQAKGMGKGKAMGGGMGGDAESDNWSMGGDPAVQDFINQNGLDNQVAKQLLSLPPGVQQMVMGDGPLTSANNPSAACMGRIRRYQPY